MNGTQKITNEEIKQKFKEKWPFIELLSEYTGANDKMVFHCTKCGHTWSTTARSVLGSKCGCPKCKKLEKYNEAAKQSFLTRMSEKYELVEWVNYADVTVKCKDCGNIRHTTADNILRFGCKPCSMKPYQDAQRKTKEQFIEEARAKHGDKYDYSKVQYVNINTKVCIICPEHGEVWMKPSKHLKGQNCPKCMGMYKQKEDFLEMAEQRYGHSFIYDKVNFINMSTPVTITCPIHGDFQVTPTNHINSGCACHQCTESSGEKAVNSILTELDIPFTRELTIINPYSEHNFRVDFYIQYNENNYIIEYNGIQHYRSVNLWGGDLAFKMRQERDAFLEKYCQENNIKLLVIKYDNKDIKQTIIDFFNVPSS